MRFLFCLLMTLTSLPALAQQLTIERIFADPALSGPTLRSPKMSPDGERVGFLKGRADDQYQLDLWTFDLKDGSTKRLVDSLVLHPDQAMSDAEKARRERERTAAYRGIGEYGWSPDGKQLLVSISGELFLVEVAHPDHARRIASGDIIDPQVSPKGHYVSFVRDQNLFVIDLADGSERKLTADGGGTIHNAEAEFVAQEEMAQTSGYWWAPDDTAIAYKRFDEAAVPVAKRMEVYADHAAIIEQRYPAAGDANVGVSLAVVTPASGVTRQIDLGTDKDIYLVRADWSADAHQLLYQRQSRDQKRLDLVAVDAANASQHTVLTETANTWVNVGDEPYFLKDGKGFIWASERSGRKHLYLFDMNGKLLHAISKGDWGIDNVLSVDEKRGLVYVASNRDAVIDMQVYALAIDGSNAEHPKRITKSDGWHEASFSKHGEAFVDTFSDPSTPPQVSVKRADGTQVAWLLHNEVTADHPYAPYVKAHLPTEFGVLKSADGQDLHYSMIKPANFDANKHYPVLLYVYGGPGVQNVKREWGSAFFQYMAQRGYVVFSLDNRGSARRERRFTDAIYQNLGKHEVEDQLTGVDWLGKQSFVDAKRIGVFGWSYGGFMSLRLLCEASDRIAAGVSVAPVTDWKLYDTHYTERYMSQPQNNVDGYAQSRVDAHLDGLHSPLLLVHGMADDNVLFANSTALMHELQQRGILFDLMTYPGAKHGISGTANQQHVFRTIEAFFNRHLSVSGQ
jgi:dipeptidyl-peptidase-4